MYQYFEFLTKLDWTGTHSAIAAVWVAIIATYALGQWKKQIKLQKQVDFIDKLTDEVHEFMLAASPVVSSIKFTKIGFESYKGARTNYKNIENNNAISFIESRGKESSDRMISYIEPLRKIVGKMKSLTVKGQIYGIENYDKCQHAISVIEHVYRQMESFAYFIGNTNLEWENPEVQRALNSVVQIDTDLIDRNLSEQNTAYLLFAQDLYKQI
jgi:hypothetical protein